MLDFEAQGHVNPAPCSFVEREAEALLA